MIGNVKDEQESIEESVSQREYENDFLDRELCAIQRKFCLNYLSDIKNPLYFKEILQYLYTLDIDIYPLFLWKRLIQYFTDGSVQIKSIDEVKMYLKRERKKM